MKESIHNDEIDLLNLIKTLWKNKKIIFIFSFFSLVIGFIIFYSLPVKYKSNAIVSHPEIGQLGNYSNAMNLIMSDFSGYNHEPTKKFFDLFLSYINAYINEQGTESTLNLIKGKDQEFYILSFVSSTPELSQSMLNDLLERFDSKTKDNIHESIENMAFNQISNIKQKIEALKNNAKEKNYFRVKALINALEISRSINLKENEVNFISGEIPNDSLFLLGEKMLSALAAKSDNLPLNLDEKYFSYQALYSSLHSLNLNKNNLKSYNLISPPSLPKLKDSPKIIPILTLSIILGIFSGIGFILTRQLINKILHRN